MSLNIQSVGISRGESELPQQLWPLARDWQRGKAMPSMHQ